MQNFLSGTIGGRLRFIRMSAGLKQKEMVKKLSDYLTDRRGEPVAVKQQSWSFYETGRQKTPVSIQNAVCAVFGVRLQWLQTGEGIMQNLDDVNYELAGTAGYPESTTVINTANNFVRDNSKKYNPQGEEWFLGLTPKDQLGLIFKAAFSFSEKDIRALIGALEALKKRMEN